MAESGAPFAHLHVHTEYSMLDGAARLKDLFAEVKNQGMTHVAMTDHGNMYGAAEFHRQAKDAGITPVIGIEAYVAPEARGNINRILWGQPHQKKDDVSAGGAYLHKTIWARDNAGPAQPVPALLPLLRRGHAGQVAPDGQGDHRGALRRPDGLHRLPVRRAADQAAARPVRRGAQGRGRRVAGHLRQGELLPRADGPRPGHRAPGPRRPGRDRQEARHPAGGHQRLALHPRTGRPVPRHAAVHPDRQDPGRRGPVPVRRHRLLHQARRRDVRPGPQRPVAGGLPQQPAADRRPGRHQRHVRLRQPDAQVPHPGRLRFRGGPVPRRGVEGHGAPLPGRVRRAAAQAGRVRDRDHLPDGVPGLLPGGRGLHHVGEEQRRRGRPGPRLRGRLDRRLRDGHHRPRPAGPRPDLRALPQPRARLHARHRHRLRRARAGRRDQVRDPEMGFGPGRADRHLRHDQGQGRDQGLLPGARPPVRARRPDHQGVPAGRDGQGHPAVRDLRREPPPVQGGRRAPLAVRGRGRGQAGHRHRPRHRGADPPARRARGRGDHVRGAADRPHPGLDQARRRRDHHAVRLPDLRGPRAAEDGLPRPAQPDDHGRRGRARSRRTGTSRSTCSACRWTTSRPTSCWPAATPSACSSSTAARCGPCCG